MINILAMLAVLLPLSASAHQHPPSASEERAERVLYQQDGTALIVQPYARDAGQAKRPISGRDSNLQGVCLYLGFGEKVSAVVQGDKLEETVIIDALGRIAGMAGYMGFYTPDYNRNSVVDSIVCKLLARP